MDQAGAQRQRPEEDSGDLSIIEQVLRRRPPDPRHPGSAVLRDLALQGKGLPLKLSFHFSSFTYSLNISTN